MSTDIKVATGKFADISNRLRALRLSLDLGSKEMASQANVSHKSYSQWESGDFRISVDGALKLRERFGVSLDFIYVGRLDTLPNSMAVALSSSPLLIASKKSNVNPDS